MPRGKLARKGTNTVGTPLRSPPALAPQKPRIQRMSNTRKAASSLLVLAAIVGGRGGPERPSTNLQASYDGTADGLIDSPSSFRAPASLPNLTIPSVISSVSHGPSAEQLLAAAVAAAVAVVAFSPEGLYTGSVINAGNWGNIPFGAALFAGSDYLAQKMEKKESIDMKRMLSASAIGILLNAFGFAYWLHYLEALFPDASVVPNTPQGAASLLCKVLMDSMVWGTVSNSAGLFLRRLLGGESYAVAKEQWDGALPEIMGDELRFWPFLQAFTYTMVPADLRVQFTACGAFMWNTYMSAKAAAAGEPDVGVVGAVADEQVVEMVEEAASEGEGGEVFVGDVGDSLLV